MNAPVIEIRDPSEESLNRVIIYDMFDSTPRPEREPTPAQEDAQAAEPAGLKPEPWGINE